MRPFPRLKHTTEHDDAIVALLDKKCVQSAHEIMDVLHLTNADEYELFDTIMDRLVKEKRVSRSRTYPNVYISCDTQVLQDFILHIAYNLE